MVGQRKKKKDSLERDVLGFTTAAVTTSVGAQVVAGAGGNPQAFTGLSKGFKPLGTAIGGLFVIRAVKDIDTKIQKKRRKGLL